MEHVIGPVNGVVKSAFPVGLMDPPVLVGGDLDEYFVTPLTRFQDQEDKNSCVWHGFFFSVESQLRGEGIVFQGCIADGYSGALFLDGNEGKDVGVQISSMCTWVKNKGVLSSFERPYKFKKPDGTIDDVTRRSPLSVDARRMFGLNPVRILVDVQKIKTVIQITGGVPHGHEVRANHVPDANGTIPIPDTTKPLRGLHLTALVGWHKDRGFLCAESWKNYGIDHPRCEFDSKFAHLKGKRGFTWRPFAWIAPSRVFEPVWIQGRLDIK